MQRSCYLKTESTTVYIQIVSGVSGPQFLITFVVNSSSVPKKKCTSIKCSVMAEEEDRFFKWSTGGGGASLVLGAGRGCLRLVSNHVIINTSTRWATRGPHLTLYTLRTSGDYPGAKSCCSTLN